MKLKLQDWSHVADIVSGIAILFTLIFLIVEVRENTDIVRAGAYDRNLDSLNDVKAILAENPQLAKNYQAVDRGEWGDLSADDQFQIRVVFEMFFGVYEKTYFAKKYGHLGDSEWGRIQRQVCLHYDRVSRNVDMISGMQIVMTDEFFDYVVESCGSKSRNE
jgi:hypothetical protein